MNMVFLSAFGSDAPGTIFVVDANGHIRPVHVDGWGVDKMVDVGIAVDVISRATRFKTPGLTDTVTKGLSQMVSKELTQHLGDQLKGGGVLVINAGAR